MICNILTTDSILSSLLTTNRRHCAARNEAGSEAKKKLSLRVVTACKYQIIAFKGTRGYYF